MESIFDFKRPAMFDISWKQFEMGMLSWPTTKVSLSTAALLQCIVLFLILVRRYRNRRSAVSTRPSEKGPLCEADDGYPSLDFSSIPSLVDFDPDNTEQHPYQPWASGKFQMTMGIRRMDENNWLVLDKKYREEQKFRRWLLENEREGVLQYLPGSEEACEETLEYIIDFLTKRYPEHFYLSGKDKEYICNGITGMKFRVNKPFEKHPLEIAAQLIMEDINLLIQGAGPDPEDHYLRASYTMGPAGWYLQERIGWPLWRIHGPVPLWHDRLRKSVEKFFRNLKVSSPVERNNFFMQPHTVLFQQDPFSSAIDGEPAIGDIHLRFERQTLRRLPRSRAVLFMVRTYLKPVVELENDLQSLWDLSEAIKAMPDVIADYKGRKIWGNVFERWSEETLKEFKPNA